jgi:hypothetical protein
VKEWGSWAKDKVKGAVTEADGRQETSGDATASAAAS